MLKKKTPERSTLPTNEKVAAIVSWLEEKKARDIVAIDIQGQSSFAEAIIIATAGSIRHGQSLSDHIRAMAKEHNYENLRTEGFRPGQWILVDLNDILLNIFQPETRDQFRLESLWANAPRLHDGRTNPTDDSIIEDDENI